MTTSVTWPQVLAWRLQRQHLDPVDGRGAVEVVRRLCGVQAQVASAATLAVRVRQSARRPATVAAALGERRLVRTWAMRGTLHLLPVDLAPSLLALCADAGTWRRAAWHKAFLSERQVDALTAAVVDAVGAEPMSREALTEAVLEHSGDESLAAELSSGWSAVLKPLAWQGLLAQGPTEGGRVSFVDPAAYVPGWPGLPGTEEAAAVAVDAYLAAYGPATPKAFGDWLLRGATPAKDLRAWFDAADLVPVAVEGEELLLRTADLDELAGTRPTGVVRLLPAFDQYVLGPGTRDPQVVPTRHRADVSRAGGWIAPVVVAGGVVVGTWSAEDAGDLAVTLWDDAPDVDPDALGAEVERVSGLVGSS